MWLLEVNTSTVRGGKDGDYMTISGAISTGYITGDRGADTLLFENTVDGSSIWGGSTQDTTNDGSDYLTFTASATSAYIQTNAGNDSLPQVHPSSIPSGAVRTLTPLLSPVLLRPRLLPVGNDSLHLGAGTYAQSTIEGGAGADYITWQDWGRYCFY